MVVKVVPKASKGELRERLQEKKESAKESTITDAALQARYEALQKC